MLGTRINNTDELCTGVKNTGSDQMNLDSLDLNSIEPGQVALLL